MCATRFMLPTSFIQGSSLADGLIYFGSTGNTLNADNFRRIKDRGQLADFLNNHAMSPATGRFNAVMIEGLLLGTIRCILMYCHDIVHGV